MMLLAGGNRQCVLPRYAESRKTATNLDMADLQVSKKKIQLTYLSHI